MTDDVDPLFDALLRARPGEYGAGPEEIVQALLRRPEWHQEAACRGAGPGRWFPARGESVEPARDVCATCPVAEQCAEAGADEGHGIWAGTSPNKRRVIRSREGTYCRLV